MSPEIMQAIRAHAEQELERGRECCGLIAAIDGVARYVPCANLALEQENFILDPADFVRVAESGEVLAVVHSHCYKPATPTQADLVGCELSGLPWLIYAAPTHQTHLFEPSGYRAPLIGRDFCFGLLDCYSIARDYLAEIGIQISNYPRRWKFWERGENLFLDNFQREGFVQIKDEAPRQHDMLLMRIASPVPNHVAVYLGENRILHHVMHRKSGRDIYGGYWQKVTTHILRHESLC